MHCVSHFYIARRARLHSKYSGTSTLFFVFTCPVGPLFYWVWIGLKNSNSALLIYSFRVFTSHYATTYVIRPTEHLRKENPLRSAFVKCEVIVWDVLPAAKLCWWTEPKVFLNWAIKLLLKYISDVIYRSWGEGWLKIPVVTTVFYRWSLTKKSFI